MINLDKVIEYISPRWAHSRAQYRKAIQMVDAITPPRKRANYEGAALGRLGSSWNPRNLTPEQMDQADRERLKARGRYLERNNDLANAVISTFNKHVIGRGIVPQPNTGDPTWNKEIERVWKLWAKQKDPFFMCDITGQQSFYDLQRLKLRRVVVDGEILVNRTYLDGQLIPFTNQVLETDHLTNSGNPATGNYMKSGVEVNKFNRPMAYHLKQSEFERDSVRLPAEQIIHLFTKFRPTQTRGISFFAPVLMRMNAIDEYVDAELIAAQIAACFAVFVRSNNPGRKIAGRSELTTNDDGEQERREKIAPGIMEYLKPGEDVTFGNPNRPNPQAGEFLKGQERFIAAALGQSYESISKDLQGASYSAARQGYLEDLKNYEIIQSWFIDQDCEPNYQEFLRTAVYSGMLPIPGFDAEPEKWMKVSWVTPARLWIDPLKEMTAAMLEIKNGINTRHNIARSKGFDYSEVVSTLKEEAEDMRDIQNIQEGGTENNTENN